MSAALIGTDAILAIEARATPVMAQHSIDVVRTLSPLPFGELVLTHYHAVRVLGAERVRRESELSRTRMTADLIDERGEQDWASEAGPHAAAVRGRRVDPRADATDRHLRGIG